MAKTNAQLKREERERKRAQGLVPKEVWIRPEYSDHLKDVQAFFQVENTKFFHYTSGKGVSIENIKGLDYE